MDKTQKRPIKLEGHLLEIVREMHNLTQELGLRQRELQGRYDQEWEEISSPLQARLASAREALEVGLGFPLEPGFALDIAYLADYGHAYVRPVEQEENDSDEEDESA